MPKLPSGRLVAVDSSPIEELAQRASDEENAGLLLFVENDLALAGLLEVVEVEWRSDIPPEELDRIDTAEGSRTAILHPIGLSAADVLRGRSSWSRPDIEAFREFLQTPRIASWALEMRGKLLSLRRYLTDRVIMWPSLHAALPQRPSCLPEAP